MRFTIILVILNCWVTISFGQTIFNIRTMSAAQNDYLGLHVRDALGDTFFNIFTDGSNPVSIYGKNGNYILRYDASDSLTLIYNSANLGVVRQWGLIKMETSLSQASTSSLISCILNLTRRVIFFGSNIITPNGDRLNDEFYLLPFWSEECIGGFKSVVILDRRGEHIFYSTDHNFSWNGDEQIGVCYYVIEFESKNFRGPVTVARQAQ